MRLGLGTAQFGLDYGITNHNGMVRPEIVQKIIERVIESNKFDSIDTAIGYGRAQSLIGEYLPGTSRLKIMTKLPSYREHQDGDAVLSVLNCDVDKSLHALKRESIDVLYFHHSEDLLSVNGDKLFKAVLKLKETGIVKKLGVSVYDAVEIDRISDRYEVDVYQLPFNLLNPWVLNHCKIHALRKQGAEIYVRSLFLQGVLLADPDGLSDRFKPIQPLLDQFLERCRHAGLTKTEALWRQAYEHPSLDGVVFGVTTVDELDVHLRAIEKKFSLFEKIDFSKFSTSNKEIYDPRSWN
ncbi:MAG TPA: aldo/keto reductase [Candidatus Omnitrophota bacterium]|nr:aldo/keto reductase [Candidatus Omnitrophota bacterium]